MSLAVTFRRSFLGVQAGNSGGDGPRKVHWTGGTGAVDLNRTQGTSPGGDPKGGDERGYHSLGKIKIGDVDQAFKFFKPHLIESPYPTWVAPGYFCMIHLLQKTEKRPSAIFGRVKTCYPADGYLQNIREMELLFPKLGGAPLEVNLLRDDIDFTSELPAESFCARIQFFLTEEDRSDFVGYEEVFIRNGFALEFIPRFVDLFDVREINRSTIPQVIIVSSRWFDRAKQDPHLRAYEILHQLIRWNKIIVNYHPLNLDPEIHTLNRELGFKHGITDISLFDPETPEQTLKIISNSFDGIFMKGMG